MTTHTHEPVWVKVWLQNINDPQDQIVLFDDLPAYDDSTDEEIDETVNEAIMNAPGRDEEIDELLDDPQYTIEWEVCNF